MGNYLNDQEIEDKLRGKVTLTDDEENTDHMLRRTFRRIVLDAESRVEIELAQRYWIPFQCGPNAPVAYAPFVQLPEVTKSALRMLCRLKAVIFVLQDDFVMGSASDAAKTVKPLEERYDDFLKIVVGKHDAEGMNWVHPPLPLLRPNYNNEEADDGRAGMIWHYTQEKFRGDYPRRQINSPGENFAQGVVHEDCRYYDD